MDLLQRRAWNENHKRLTDIIVKPEEHFQAIEQFLHHHALLHSSKMTNDGMVTLEDYVLADSDEGMLRNYPVSAPDTKNSIVWHLWHMARIEDMTMNLLESNGCLMNKPLFERQAALPNIGARKRSQDLC
ncbi:hypothetical protein [Paenibacillus sp. NPDC058071]|uniref:hypothetical protein n=1 Tax=Paenibacillus sp. NPDC058071 TaxID=3346326 RepID=UPI0036D86184